MANKLVNRAKMTVSGTPGTGTVTLGSASTGYMDFVTAGVLNADVVSYLIEDGTSWEFGAGTYTTSGTTLARTTVIASSAGGTTKISATSAATVAIVPFVSDLNPTGGSSDQAFYLNSTTVNNSYTIPTGMNAGTFGPVTIAFGAVVTVPSGSVWSIV